MDHAATLSTSQVNWIRHPLSRGAMVALLALSAVSTVLMGSGVLSEEAAFEFSSIVYPIVSIGAGAMLVGAAFTLHGPRKYSWAAIGAGVLCWGIGETIWVYFEYIQGLEVPYPGSADVFYVLGYPLMFFGVLLLPANKQGRLEKLRLSMDAFAGTIAVAAIMWVVYLKDLIYLDPEIGFLEQFINIMYPLGDLILLIAVMILTVSRTSYQFDIRFLALAVGLIATSFADVIYVLQVEADTYASGGWLDSLWLGSYGAYALVGWYLLRPVTGREQTLRAARLWQLAAPYMAIAALFAMTLWDVGGDASVLEMASGLVGVLIIGRQGVAIRENRELVEKQRDDLIASISHELRTPLTSVQGFAQILSENGERLAPAQRAELASTIEHQTRHLSGIVTDLVDVARNRLSSTDLQLEVENVEDLIARATEMLPQSSEIADVVIDAEPGLCVQADRRRMTQVLVNLLTNADRYGNGRIRVAAHREDGHILIDVHDNGPGVPKRYEEIIWERFERGAHRLDATTPGSGIGLPIARSLAQAHGGTITYRRSHQLGGSCFTVELPAPANAKNSTSREDQPKQAGLSV